MQRFMIYVLLIYIVALALGMNFFLAALSFGLLGWELMLVLLITLLPAFSLLIYFFRANIADLENHERALHYLIYITLGIAVIFVSVVIVPAIYI